jgi:hypothetical protein
MTERPDRVVGVAVALVAGWAAFWRIGIATILVDEPTYADSGRLPLG